MCHAWWNVINIGQIEMGVHGLVGICFRMFGWLFADKFHRDSLTSWVLLVWFGTEWHTSITKSHRSWARIPSMRKPASREMISASVELCENWSLFLAHPTYWHKCSASENAQNSSWCWLGIFKVSCKIRVLIKSWSALLCCVSHKTILPKTYMCDECTRSNALNVCHMLLTISFAHKQICSHTIKNGSTPIRAKYRHFRTICEQTVDKSPTDPFSSSSNWW